MPLIANAVIGLGHSLGHIVIAEGVETANQAELLKALGCDGVQGYYFGRPMPIGDVRRMASGVSPLSPGSGRPSVGLTGRGFAVVSASAPRRGAPV